MCTKPCGKQPVAEAHAAACYDVLTRHLTTSTRCGCRLDESASFPSVVVAPGCQLGSMLLEEFELASRRVRELYAVQ